MNETERPMYYVLDGKKAVPVETVQEWAAQFQSSKRIVKQEMISDVKISTVFLGLDHSFLGVGPPILFETMIFGGEHNEYQERYSTWEEAEAGHAVAVVLVRGTK